MVTSVVPTTVLTAAPGLGCGSLISARADPRAQNERRTTTATSFFMGPSRSREGDMISELAPCSPARRVVPRSQQAGLELLQLPEDVSRELVLRLGESQVHLLDRFP